MDYKYYPWFWASIHFNFKYTTICYEQNYIKYRYHGYNKTNVQQQIHFEFELTFNNIIFQYNIFFLIVLR